MHRHAYFALELHDSDELAAWFGEAVVERTELHAWPLSSVELVRLASGQRWIYKVQRQPTVEAEFLSRAGGAPFPACRVITRSAEQDALVVPFYTAPTLRDATNDAGDSAAIGRALVARFAEAPVSAPLYRDLGSIERWRVFADETLQLLHALVADGRFALITRDDLTMLATWAEDRAVLDLIDTTSQLINGDLKAEHIFRGAAGDGGDIVIDWQRPYRAPADIDVVSLLGSLDIAPEAFVVPAAIGLHAFLFVHWAAIAKFDLLPHLPFFDSWAREGLDRIWRSR